jgi:hypothetical protein
MSNVKGDPGLSFCVRELGECMTTMVKKLGISLPAFGYAVNMGKITAKANGINLVD